MTDLILIILATVLVNNFVLTRFLGLCPFLGASNRFEAALGMALATTFVLTLAAGVGYLVDHHVLIPLDLQHLRLLSFILVIAATVQFTELVIRRSSPLLHQVLGLFLPLITTNCAVLGIALLNARQSHDFLTSLAFGLGGGLGFSLVIVLFSGLRERVEAADVPQAFRGAAVSLITAAFMALGFMGFTGLVQV